MNEHNHLIVHASMGLPILYVLQLVGSVLQLASRQNRWLPIRRKHHFGQIYWRLIFSLNGSHNCYGKPVNVALYSFQAICFNPFIQYLTKTIEISNHKINMSLFAIRLELTANFHQMQFNFYYYSLRFELRLS